LLSEPARARRSSNGISPRLVLGLALLALVIGGGAGVGLYLLTRSSAAPLSAKTVLMRNGLYGDATWAADSVKAPAINTLHDQSGARFALSSLHGRTVAIAFFDSYCRQECPLEGRQLAAAERRLPATQRPELLVVSVNPKDNATSVAKAVRDWGLVGVAPWHWLMGSHAQLARIWAEYGIQVSPPVDGDINHTEALYLVDRKGYERAGYLWPFASRFATYDMRTLATGRVA
jgi:cytochrome oxidase Cu insertion factor (SCO1/SenC/PrrC family)